MRFFCAVVFALPGKIVFTKLTLIQSTFAFFSTFMQNLLWYNCKLISNDKNNYFIFYAALSPTSKIHGVLVGCFWDVRHERVAQLLQ